jgi:hypothetical protein
VGGDGMDWIPGVSGRTGPIEPQESQLFRAKDVPNYLTEI